MRYASFQCIYNCCGIYQLGNWKSNTDPYGKPLDDLPGPTPITGGHFGYSGIFVATFNRSYSNKKAEEYLKSQGHTLLFETENYSNQSMSAEAIGREQGVKLCVFLHKDTGAPIPEKE